MAFGLWQLVFMVALVVPPTVAIALENTDQRLDRRDFAFWFIASIGVWALLALMSRLTDHPLANMARLVVFCLFAFFYAEKIAQRTRDAGLAKIWSYLFVIPMVGFAYSIFLLMKDSEPAAETDLLEG